MRLISWNVNGVRAAERKGFLDWLERRPADVVCIQETKVSDPAVLSDALRSPDGYTSYWQCAAEKKGYSGVATFTRIAPKAIVADFGTTLLSAEGRVLRTDIGDITLFNVYFPNGGASDARLKYKLEFYKQFLTEMKKLIAAGKHIVFCGDVNTAHRDIDLARPKENIGNSGFLPVERAWLDKFEAAGFIDTFRLLHPGKKDAYSWWDMKTRARERNVGWRIDYFWVSHNLASRVKRAEILPDIMGSDHCPIALTLDV